MSVGTQNHFQFLHMLLFGGFFDKIVLENRFWEEVSGKDVSTQIYKFLIFPIPIHANATILIDKPMYWVHLQLGKLTIEFQVLFGS